MPKFRKKPVIVEAFQMTKERRADNSGWPEWLNIAWAKNPQIKGALYPKLYPRSTGSDELMIHTLEGERMVDWNDWIIQEVNGELYPCKSDIFELNYELVED